MNNYYEDILDKALNSENGLVTIRHYNNFWVDSEYLERLQARESNVFFLYKNFYENRMSGPFGPFLGWVKELCGQYNISIPELLEKCEVYPMHRAVFSSFIEEGIARRKEEALINEIEFEKKLFSDEVVRMLGYLARKKKICLLLDNLSLAGYSTLVIVKKLMQRNIENISIVCSYNETEDEVEYTKEIWEELVEFWEDGDFLLDIVGEEVNENIKFSSGYSYSSSLIEEDFRNISNLYVFMCYRQAEHYLNIFYHKFEVEKLAVDTRIKFKFFELYALTAMYMEKTAESLLYLNGMQQLLEELGDAKWAIRYNMMAARVYMYGFQQTVASEHLNKCKAILGENADAEILFKIELLEHMVFFQGWRNIWLLNTSISELDDLIEHCKEYGYDNHLAHIYVYAFDNEAERYSNLAGLNIKLPHFLQGMRVAQRIGNYHFMIEAYKKNVLLASTNGFYNTANYFNEKIKEISVKYDDKFELANIYNGMGYNCCVMEEYERASENYNKALEMFMESNDMESVNETIYNLAINAVLAMDYEKADNLLQLCLKCISLIGANSVKVCNISKIYGLRAFCDYKMGQYYNTMINLQYVEQFLGHIIELENQDVDAPHLWDDDLVIFYTVSALMDAKHGMAEGAYCKIKTGRKYIDRATGSKFLFFVPYAILYAKIARLNNDEIAAGKILAEAKRYCRENNFTKRAECLKLYIEGKSMPNVSYDIGIRVTTPEEIIRKAKYIGLAKNYRLQKQNLDFLGIWQKVLSSNEKEFDRVLGNAFATLMNQYNLDDFIFIRMEKGSPVIKYISCDKEITDDKLWYIVDYFNENRNAIKTSRLDKGYTKYQKFINRCFDFNSISTFIGVPIFSNERLDSIFLASVQMNMEWNYKSKRYIFDNDDLSVFIMLYHNVIEFIERFDAQKEIAKANSRLRNMAIKDQLTGIFNRQGMGELFSASQFENIAIIYADLDNFKYYNDTYGHDVGDKVLVEYAKLLGKVTSLQADAVRYGGDEFLLIMYTDDKIAVQEAVENIYRRLRESHGLTVEVSKAVGYEIEIPLEKQLSCSIGIAMGKINDSMDKKEQIVSIMKRADTMLYRVKHTTKNSYKFYEY